MARETKIEYQNKGFWIPEAFIEVLSQFICEAFEASGVSSFSTNLQGIYEDCNANRHGSRYGMVDILLDDSIGSSADQTDLINVLNQAKSLILSQGDQLSITWLNQFENNKEFDSFKGSWGNPIQTQSLASTIDIMIQLINGIWGSDNAGIYYSGFPNPDGVIPI